MKFKLNKTQQAFVKAVGFMVSTSEDGINDDDVRVLVKEFVNQTTGEHKPLTEFVIKCVDKEVNRLFIEQAY